MLNIKQLFSSLLSDSDNVVDACNSIIQTSNSVLGEKPAFTLIKLRNLATNFSTSFQLFTDFMDVIDITTTENKPEELDIDDYNTQFEIDFDNDSDMVLILSKLLSCDPTVQSIHDHFMDLPDNPAIEYINVGNISGFPLSVKFTHYKVGGVHGGIDVEVNLRDDDQNNAYTFHRMHMFCSIRDSLLKCTTTLLNAFDVTQVEQSYISLNDILMNAESNISDNQIVAELIEAASMQGNIAKENVIEILNKYGETPFTSFCRDAIAGVGEFSFLSLTTIVGQWFQKTKGNHATDSEYYEPMEYKTFCANVIAAITTTLVTIIGSLLNIVFTVISTALGIIFAIFQSIVDRIIGSFDKAVEANVKDISADPAYDFPFRVNVPATWIRGTAKDIENYGVLALTLLNEPCFSMLIGQSDPEHTWNQWVINGGGYKLEKLPQVFGYTMGQPYYELNCVATTGHFEDVRKYEIKVDDTMQYVDATDIQMRRWIEYAIIRHIIDQAAVGSGHTPAHMEIETGADYGAALLYLGNHYDDGVTTPIEIINYLSATFGLGNDYAALLYVTFMITGGLGGAQGPFSYDFNDYFTDNDIWTWDRITRILPLLLNSLVLPQMLTATTAPYYRINDSAVAKTCGTAKLNPVIQWPTKSRHDLMISLITGVVSATVLAGTAFLAKRKLKNYAAGRLASREAQFQNDLDKLKKDPSNAALKRACAKSNRKLTRAWKFAGKAGLTTYNGFDTGAGSSDSASAQLNVPSYLGAAEQAQTIEQQILLAITGVETEEPNT